MNRHGPWRSDDPVRIGLNSFWNGRLLCGTAKKLKLGKYASVGELGGSLKLQIYDAYFPLDGFHLAD